MRTLNTNQKKQGLYHITHPLDVSTNLGSTPDPIQSTWDPLKSHYGSRQNPEGLQTSWRANTLPHLFPTRAHPHPLRPTQTLPKPTFGSILGTHKPPHTSKSIGSHLSLYLLACHGGVRHTPPIYIYIYNSSIIFYETRFSQPSQMKF